MIELIILIVIISVVLFKINHPHFKWSCMVGLHTYHYSYEKHGMYLDKKSHNVVGTQRKVYKCYCGKEKPAAKADWI